MHVSPPRTLEVGVSVGGDFNGIHFVTIKLEYVVFIRILYSCRIHPFALTILPRDLTKYENDFIKMTS